MLPATVTIEERTDGAEKNDMEEEQEDTEKGEIIIRVSIIWYDIDKKRKGMRMNQR